MPVALRILPTVVLAAVAVPPSSGITAAEVRMHLLLQLIMVAQPRVARTRPRTRHVVRRPSRPTRMLGTLRRRRPIVRPEAPLGHPTMNRMGTRERTGESMGARRGDPAGQTGTGIVGSWVARGGRRPSHLICPGDTVSVALIIALFLYRKS